MTVAGKRVLVAEDEYFIAKGLVRDLRVLGVEVAGPAPSIPDALALIEAGPLDGAVLDVNLRGEMAFPLADALADRGVPFVFATGYSLDILPARFAGVSCCEKPVDAGRLVALLFPSAPRPPSRSAREP